jgi:hypothetical protein
VAITVPARRNCCAALTVHNLSFSKRNLTAQYRHDVNFHHSLILRLPHTVNVWVFNTWYTLNISQFFIYFSCFNAARNLRLSQCKFSTSQRRLMGK